MQPARCRQDVASARVRRVARGLDVHMLAVDELAAFGAPEDGRVHQLGAEDVARELVLRAAEALVPGDDADD